MTPVAAWFTYSLVVGLLVSLSALLGEAALRAGGRPVRWAWVGGMAATVIVPVAAVLGSMGWAEPVSLMPVAVIPLAPLAVSFEPTGSGIPLDTWLLAGWAVLAVGCLSYLLWMHRHVARGGAEGHPARVAGVGVLVTRRLGPAVFGVRRAKILVPEWTLGLDVRLRRLMMLHEGEHARAGDGQLVLGALVLAAAVPWNLPLWFQLARLRAAVELDCDARVLRRIPDRSGYGGLLLEVGRRGSERLLGVAMAERRTQLEHRLCRITEVTRRPDVRRALWLGGVAGLLLAVAAFTRDPNTPSGDPGMLAAMAVQDTSILARGPMFTPFTQAPRLSNPEEVKQALEAAYPKLLRDAGIGGDVIVWFLIGEDGRVRKTQINESSGYPVLDEAALKVAAVMEFTPALNRDKVVPVWVSIPIRFTTGAEPADVAPPESRVRVQIPPTPEQLKAALGQHRVIPPASAEVMAGTRQEVEAGDAPVFTPFTQAPRLVNQAEVAQALERRYPAPLREAGIGGEVHLWMFIDEVGKVLATQINQSNGYPALDEAAEEVARMMQFTPALNRDRKVRVWVSIPITFNAIETTRPFAYKAGPEPRRVAVASNESVADEIASQLLSEPSRAAKSPTFTPFTQAPRLVNQAEVARALESNYPPLLRNAAVGGEVRVWFFIDEEGKVLRTQIDQSSGYPGLDEAAERVAGTMRFTPAMNRNQKVQVWVSIPIKFSTK